MAVQQTECYKVVTIGYLKEFISDFIQDSNGETLTISSSFDDALCPTYSQLTGGTIIQNGSLKANPNDDVDGIVINPTCLATGIEYDNNQLVNQSDLSVIYTRYESLSFFLYESIISECGGSTASEYENRYIRGTIEFDENCEGSRNESTVTSKLSAPTAYTSSDEAFTVSSNGVVSVGKNSSPTGQADVRHSAIRATSKFRNTDFYSNAAAITQEQLSGDWVDLGDTGYRIDSKGIDSTGSTYGCEGGTYQAIRYNMETIWTIEKWEDSCGEVYDNITRNTGETSGNKVFVDPLYSGSFSACTVSCSNSASTPASWATEGYGTKTWTQDCDACGCDKMVIDKNVITFSDLIRTNSIQYTAQCPGLTNVGVSGLDSTYFTYSISNGTITITANNNLDPSTYPGSTFNITYDAQNVGSCYKSVAIECANIIMTIESEDMCGSEDVEFKDFDVDINITKS